jgi:cation transport ATPase
MKKDSPSERFCIHCNGLGYVTESLSQKEDNLSKMIVCMACNVSLKLGEAEVTVTGEKSTEVKDVISHLAKQIHDEHRKNTEIQNKQQLEKELHNNTLKLLLIGGGFWLGIFAAIFYMVFSLAESKIHWYRFIGAIVTLPIFFTILGAFILRSTSSINEKNFLALIKLTLNLNFKGLKVLRHGHNSKKLNKVDFEPVE